MCIPPYLSSWPLSCLLWECCFDVPMDWAGSSRCNLRSVSRWAPRIFVTQGSSNSSGWSDCSRNILGSLSPYTCLLICGGLPGWSPSHLQSRTSFTSTASRVAAASLHTWISAVLDPGLTLLKRHRLLVAGLQAVELIDQDTPSYRMRMWWNDFSILVMYL
jgi:hypothetical protein